MQFVDTRIKTQWKGKSLQPNVKLADNKPPVHVGLFVLLIRFVETKSDQ